MPSPEMQRMIDLAISTIGSIPEDLAGRRALGERIAALQAPLDPAVNVEPTEIAGVPAEWIWSDDADPSRVVLYCHGGGFISGSAPEVRPFVGRLARWTRARFVSIDYRLAPENPCPAAVEDTVAVYRALVDAPGPPVSVVMGGDSAGGGLVLSALVALRDGGAPRPAGAFAISPLVDMTLKSTTMLEEPSPDPVATIDEFRRIVAYYLAGAPPASPLASPLHAELHGLPPIHLEATTERLLDDSRSFAAKSRQAGTEASLEVTDGCIHNFVQVAPDAPESIAAVERIVDRIDAWFRAAGR